jgi:hypothetical protein
MEELEALDQKAFSEQGAPKYTYTNKQKAIGIIAIIVVVLGLIGASVYVFVNVFDILLKK